MRLRFFDKNPELYWYYRSEAEYLHDKYFVRTE